MVKLKTQKSKIKNRNREKSFTIIEVVVVVGVMGFIVGGLMLGMRQIIQEEMTLKGIQEAEEQGRYITDLFSLDAEYSELNTSNNYRSNTPSTKITFNLSETSSDLSGNTISSVAAYTSYQENGEWFLQKKLCTDSDCSDSNNFTSVTLNTLPLYSQPLFMYQKVYDPSGSLANDFITISLVFSVKVGAETSKIPIQTSVMSRTFEF